MSLMYHVTVCEPGVLSSCRLVLKLECALFGMPSCCRCNKKGVCRGCDCARSGRPCTSCLPLRLGQCSNVSVSSVVGCNNNDVDTGTTQCAR
mgnify:CR=1 FL=1